MVHVLSGQWPFPGEAVRVNPNDPSDVTGVTEFDRREEYINLIGREHPLMTLIQGCLSNSPSHRPTSTEVHRRVSVVAIDHPLSFTNRVEMMERIKALNEEKDKVGAEKETAVTQRDASISEQSRIIAEMQSNIDSLQESHSIEVEALQTSNRDLKANIEHFQAIISANLRTFSPAEKITFTECAKVPEGTNSLDQGIVIGKDVYFGVDLDRNVLKYNITEDAWSTFPMTPVKQAGIGCINDKLLPVLVGGRLSYDDQVTAIIHEFDDFSRQWVRSTSIPPMPTARAVATVVSWSSPSALIVCGGGDQQLHPMTVVEVYHSRTSQWHTLSPLPYPRSIMTHTVIHSMLYLVGGFEYHSMHSDTKTVLSASIPQLLETCLQPSPIQWQSLPISNVPHYSSTAASLGGCLLAVGGRRERLLTFPLNPDSVVSSVHAYCPFTSSWVLVGQLPQPLFSCTTATLPTGELLVMGGTSHSCEATDTNYKCSLSLSILGQ